MKKLDMHARDNLDMIIGFIRAGGNPETPFIVRFCQEWGIGPGQLASCAAPKEKADMVEELRKAGLV